MTTPQASAEERPTRAFHGIVRDALSGALIAGARASLSSAARGEASPELAATGTDEATSDGAGRFVLSLSAGPRLGIGQLTAEGYGPGTFVLDRAHGTPERAEVVELLPAATLDVHVTNPLGHGLERVTVELGRKGGGVPIFRGGGVVTRWPDRQLGFAYTDASGVARFAGLGAEVVLGWTVRSSAGAPWREGLLALAPGENRRLEVVLGGNARVSGRVRDEQDAPLCDLPIFLAPESNGTHHGDSQRTFETKSDSAGAFEFQGVPFDTYRLGHRSDAQGFLPLDEALEVDRDWIERDLSLTHGLFLSGRVAGAMEPSAGDLGELAVRVLSLDGGPVVAGELDDFAFRVGPLPPGEYLVSAIDSVWTEVVRARAGDSDIELHLVPPVEVSVRVQGVEGKVELVLIDLERASFSVWSEDSSHFTPELMPGTYAYWATAGDAVGIVPRFVVPSRGIPAEVVLDLRPGAHCTVVHAATDRRRSLRLFVSSEAVPLGGVTFRDDLYPGASESVFLPAGPLTAELVEDGRVVAREDVLLAPGERRRIVLAPR